MRVLLVFGTRPEAIKLIPVIFALRQHPEVEIVICTAGQHRQMLDQVLAWFRITPEYDLNLMQPNQSLSDLTARALQAITGVMQQVSPDVVLSQGDTTTAFVTALAAFYLRIPVGHVEAGLRTHNLYNPFPEEANRHLISVLASYHFAPTENARQVLLAEGVNSQQIFVTGNTVIDALQWTLQQPVSLDLPIPLDRRGEKLILVTAHRRESFGKEFENICHALKQIVERNPEVRLVYPVHLNPNVKQPVYQLLSNVERIHLIEPLSYEVFTHLMNRVYLVLTDSGGLQEEAPALGKPVLVMRQTTERPEAVEAGVAMLVGTNTETIVTSAEALLHDPVKYQAMAQAVSPFGDGMAAQKIVNILLQLQP